MNVYKLYMKILGEWGPEKAPVLICPTQGLPGYWFSSWVQAFSF